MKRASSNSLLLLCGANWSSGGHAHEHAAANDEDDANNEATDPDPHCHPGDLQCLLSISADSALTHHNGYVEANKQQANDNVDPGARAQCIALCLSEVTYSNETKKS